MADEESKKSNDPNENFDLQTPMGLQAYPKVLHFPTDKKYSNGEPVTEDITVKTVEEHKKVLEERKNKAAWSK